MGTVGHVGRHLYTRFIGAPGRGQKIVFRGESRSRFIAYRWAYSRTEGNGGSSASRTGSAAGSKRRPPAKSRRGCMNSRPPSSFQRGVTRVEGPQTITPAPVLQAPNIRSGGPAVCDVADQRDGETFERARRCRIVRMSNSPWVGCSCGPSPAFRIEARIFCDKRWGVPGVLCRTTIASTPIASRFLAVSMNDSPLKAAGRGGKINQVGTEATGGQCEADLGSVEFSKNRLTHVLPESNDIRRSPRATG